jgi:DNA-binding phage protein
MAKVLKPKDVIVLLGQRVQQAGGISAWSKKTGIDRAIISRALHGRRPPTKSIINALKLRMVYVAKD